MPEFRQNLATKEWVVIASDRKLAAASLVRKPVPRGPTKKADCPFCPGNEKMLTETVSTMGLPQEWKVKAVRNKHPVLMPNAPKIESPGLYRKLPAEGIHEVIIEGQNHSADFEDLAVSDAQAVVAMYRERFAEASKDFNISLTTLFKNRGSAAGTTLEHAHAQLVGSSVVPAHVRHRMDEAQRYFDQNAECVFCRIVEEERKDGTRVVGESKHFIAFVLFAALSPFHIWIVPKRHTPSFPEMSDDESRELAAILQATLKKLDVLGDPDYNFVIQSTPQDRGVTDAFHWYMSLVVRLGKVAGFEMGSGMFLNSVVPEEAAAFLNGVAVKA